MFAEFELRNGNVSEMRNIFGECIGRSPKLSVIRRYIAIEYQMGE